MESLRTTPSTHHGEAGKTLPKPPEHTAKTQDQRILTVDHSCAFGPSLLSQGASASSPDNKIPTARYRKIDHVTISTLKELDQLKYTPSIAGEKIHKLLANADNRDSTINIIFNSNLYHPPTPDNVSGSLDSPFFKADLEIGQFFSTLELVNFKKLKNLLETIRKSLPPQSNKHEAIRKLLDLVNAAEKETIPEKFPSHDEIFKLCELNNTPSDSDKRLLMNMIGKSLLPHTGSRCAITMDTNFIGKLATHMKSGDHPPFVLEIHAGHGVLASELQKREVPIIATDACISNTFQPHLLKQVYFSFDIDAVKGLEKLLCQLQEKNFQLSPYILCSAPGGSMAQFAGIMLDALQHIEKLRIIIIGISNTRDPGRAERALFKNTRHTDLTKKLEYVGQGHGNGIDNIFEFRKL